MKRTDYNEDRDKLRQIGFTAREIEHLSILRTRYSKQELNQKTVVTSPSQYTLWFERAIRMLLERCRLLVFSEDRFWSGD